MALKMLAALLPAICALASSRATAQSLTAETAVFGGYSTDETTAGSSQLRVFGDLGAGIRYFGELSWAASSDDDNDAFAAAYPYGNRIDVIEAYAERIFRPAGALFSVRGGRFRPPFGIYNASDHAYTGFLRPPLIRYDEYSGVSNFMLEQGADVSVGAPWLSVETALGAPGDVGSATRASGLDSVTRVQAYYGPLVAGASYIHTPPVETAGEHHEGASRFGGVDFRWTHKGVQLRGEWIDGRPFDGASTSSWYVDGIVHVLGMGPVTAVARIERLSFDEAAEHEHSVTDRQTLGARVRLPAGFSFTVNVVHRAGDLKEYPPTSLDIGLAWSGRRGPL